MAPLIRVLHYKLLRVCFMKGESSVHTLQSILNSFSLSSDKTQLPRLWESFHCSQRNRAFLGNWRSCYSALSHTSKFPNFRISLVFPYFIVVCEHTYITCERVRHKTSHFASASVSLGSNQSIASRSQGPSAILHYVKCLGLSKCPQNITKE
jgi:hypothetical protein